MPPQTPDPRGSTPPPNPVPNPGASAHVDLGKVLLPKKETPGTTTQSAQRINAGVLFEQERTATLPETPKPEPVPAAVPTPPKPEPTLVKPLQTYQGDIESVVGEKNISIVSIAAAEADRRGMSKLEDSAAPLNQTGRPWLRKLALISAGVAMLAMAGGVGFYIYLAFQPVSVAEQSPAPFILVDDTKTVQISPSDTRSTLMQALSAARSEVSLALGLVARIQVVKPTALGDSLVEVSAPELLQTLAPRIPLELVRTLEPQMLLGVHSYDENQAFMLLKADSYETAYSGMLDWESTMQLDLNPLFLRTPAVRLRPDTTTLPLPVATSTATTTGTQPQASSTPATTTPAAATPAPIPSATPFVQGSFIDKVVENRDTRLILGPEGDILLLWTFLDRSTIVVATNDATLREVISRLSQASILSLPAGQ